VNGGPSIPIPAFRGGFAGRRDCIGRFQLTPPCILSTQREASTMCRMLQRYPFVYQPTFFSTLRTTFYAVLELFSDNVHNLYHF
jgi:hypothetical protein